MKVFLIAIIILSVIYLNRSYAYFYDYMKTHQLPQPINQNVTLGDKGAAKTIKYVALGDSLTAGVGSSNYRNALPYLIGNNMLVGSIKLDLINLAQSGVGVEEVLNKQVPQAISEKPDVITLLIGINDIHNLVSVSDFQKKYSQIISNLNQQTSAKILIINIPYLGSNRTILPPYSLLLDIQTRKFNDAIKLIAKKSGIKYIDLYASNKESFNSDNDLYSIDGFHPSDKGYAFFGEIINASTSK